ncbi:Uncharacterised protein [Pseudomonas putida]|nr:Uncharacterised protein [Pseudomonas putida]CAB5539857.1 Uncharacterised protein [Pseudomonas putida]CAB5579810.1 Uncharacterised protein [Pseudomonas putida]CAB5588962.1 Uncharacterised protein [Pseudomonas putida]CAB5668052.1 Uncharacterised protein [Pseudomonas putida]
MPLCRFDTQDFQMIACHAMTKERGKAAILCLMDMLIRVFYGDYPAFLYVPRSMGDRIPSQRFLSTAAGLGSEVLHWRSGV